MFCHGSDIRKAALNYFLLFFNVLKCAKKLTENSDILLYIYQIKNTHIILIHISITKF